MTDHSNFCAITCITHRDSDISEAGRLTCEIAVNWPFGSGVWSHLVLYRLIIKWTSQWSLLRFLPLGSARIEFSGVGGRCQRLLSWLLVRLSLGNQKFELFRDALRLGRIIFLIDFPSPYNVGEIQQEFLLLAESLSAKSNFGEFQ
jgi:hypothetical protein